MTTIEDVNERMHGVSQVRDVDVRQALTVRVARQMGKRPHLLVPEVDIRWSVPARVDALLVSDRIAAYEIKSDVDSLARLPRQMAAYSMVVERATMVVGQRHLEAVWAALPAWWGIWVARSKGSEVVIRQLRGGRLNPCISPLAVTSFLPRDDLIAALKERGHRGLSTMSVDDLRVAVTAELGASGTMRFARTAMLMRQDWRGRSLAVA